MGVVKGVVHIFHTTQLPFLQFKDDTTGCSLTQAEDHVGRLSYS